MDRTGNSEYFTILEQFQTFYLELIQLKRSAHAQPLLPDAAGTIEVLPEGGKAEAIWLKAAEILDRQSRNLIHAGPIEAGLHREARFVMAALADEVFVHPRWEGTDYWLSHLLETRLFHTHSAGETFFLKLSALLSRNDPATDQLAMVYLMALALGFRGKYAGTPDGEAVLQSLRTRLYNLIQSRHSSLLAAGEHLFPEAYLFTIHEGVQRRLPARGLWVAIAVSVVLGWYLVSSLTWWELSRDLKARLPEVPSALVDGPTVSAP